MVVSNSKMLYRRLIFFHWKKDIVPRICRKVFKSKIHRYLPDHKSKTNLLVSVRMSGEKGRKVWQIGSGSFRGNVCVFYRGARFIAKKSVLGRICGHWKKRQWSFSLVFPASLPIQIGRKDLFMLFILRNFQLQNWESFFLIFIVSVSSCHYIQCPTEILNEKFCYYWNLSLYDSIIICVIRNI